MNIRQFECNPHLQTTIRSRHNSKHVDKRPRIVQEMASKISQAVRCRWYVRRWGWVGPDAGKSFGRVSRAEVSTIAIVILLDMLNEIIGFDRYVEKKGPTHRGKRVCLGWDWFGDSVIPIHVHIWSLRGLRSRCGYVVYVSKSEGKPNILSMTIAYRWRGRVVVCPIVIVIGCVDVWWVLHFAWHNYISYWWRDAFLVVTSHLRVLKYDTHG